jgi:hypothetical protein
VQLVRRLCGAQADRVRIPVPARPTVRLVWRRCLFYVTLRPGARSQALQLSLYSWIKIAVAGGL